MEIEKVMTVAAPSAQVWKMLLDPNVMGSCVPGMKSIEVVSDMEYVAVIHVKISFISAKFKLRTTIVEQKAPHYMRCEGTGEDASVASSLKQQTEIFLADVPGGGTELRMKVTVDVLGRLGTFGLSVMKTKADRMWEEFGQNLVARLEGREGTAVVPVATAAPAAPAPAPAVAPAAAPAVVTVPAATPALAVAAAPQPVPEPVVGPAPGWWDRLLGRSGPAEVLSSEHIRIEVRRADAVVTVQWPVRHGADCAAWLKQYLAS